MQQELRVLSKFLLSPSPPPLCTSSVHDPLLLPFRPGCPSLLLLDLLPGICFFIWAFDPSTPTVLHRTRPQ
jgi:hypothetical protein